MSKHDDFAARVARTQRHDDRVKMRRSERRDDAAQGLLKWVFDVVIDIVMFGWWALFGGIAFIVLAGIATLSFLGFDVEFFLAVTFVAFIAIGLASYLWES